MRYNGPANRSDYAAAVAASGDGSKVVVTGSSARISLDLDWATVAYDAKTGAQLWSQRYNGPGNGTDQPTALGSSPDGTKVFVTGHSGGAGTGFDYATVSYDGATGAPLWASRYDGPAHDSDEANSLAVSPDGTRVFVTGYNTGTTTGQDYATVSYDSATGSQQWVARHNGLNDWPDVAESIAAGPDGSTVYVTGGTQREMGRLAYATVAYAAASGSELWRRRLEGPGGRSDYAFSIAVSPDGSKVFVTGESALGTTDWATVAYWA
jgi:WD40 repeat protein